MGGGGAQAFVPALCRFRGIRINEKADGTLLEEEATTIDDGRHLLVETLEHLRLVGGRASTGPRATRSAGITGVAANGRLTARDSRLANP
jgi:hypothetical protein